MADPAHRWTDEKLEEMERRLSAIYSASQKQIQTKMLDFAKGIDGKARELLQAIKEAETDKERVQAEKAYLQYFKRDVVRSKAFKALSAEIALALFETNTEASAYINSQTPEIYALNYNWINEQLANDIPDFVGQEITADEADQYGELTKQTVSKGKDTRWNESNIKKSVIVGATLLLGANAIMKRAASTTVQKNRNSASMHNSGMGTDAENKARLDGMYRASDMGNDITKIWIATLDNRTRDSHARLDGDEIPLDDTFDNGLERPRDPNGEPAEVCNCFIGETNIAVDSNISKSYKREYCGQIVSIKTAGGVNFSSTPNHPILTPNGWISAKLLKNGDNILVTFGEHNVFGGVNPDIKHRFPRIDAIHKFGKKMGGKRACDLRVDFHGDIAASDVEIVAQKRLLRGYGKSGLLNKFNKFFLKFPNKSLSGHSSFMKHFGSVRKAAFGFIGRHCKPFPFFWRGLRHSNIHGSGTTTNRDVVLPKYAIEDTAADFVIDGEPLDRLSGKVFVDNIVDIDIRILKTHVYNLQTENGYYFVNSIIPQNEQESNGIFAIAKNCRCSLKYGVGQAKGKTRAARRGDVSGSYKRPSSFKGTQSEEIANMSYGEWMKWRKAR